MVRVPTRALGPTVALLIGAAVLGLVYFGGQIGPSAEPDRPTQEGTTTRTLLSPESTTTTASAAVGGSDGHYSSVPVTSTAEGGNQRNVVGGELPRGGQKVAGRAAASVQPAVAGGHRDAALHALFKRSQLPANALRSKLCTQCAIMIDRETPPTTAGGLTLSSSGSRLHEPSTLSSVAPLHLRCALLEEGASAPKCPPLTGGAQQVGGKRYSVHSAKAAITSLVKEQGEGKPSANESAAVTGEVAALLRSSCDWSGSNEKENTKERWKGWNTLRVMASPSVQHHVDCFPPLPPPVSCHHLPRFEASRPSIQTELKAASRPMHISVRSDIPTSTVTKHKLHGSWLQLDNVCVACEVGRRWFMPAGLNCYHTVYSLNTEIPRLSAASRNGRHKLFKEREGGFQYGGVIQTAIGGVPKQFAWVNGTSFLNTPFTVDNVGHIIHDGLWAFASSILGRSELKLPRPYRYITPAHLFNNSNAFYSYITTAMGLFGMTHTPEEILQGTTAVHRTLMTNGSADGLCEWFPEDSEIFHAVSAAAAAAVASNNHPRPETAVGKEGRPLLCFDSIVFGGQDQKGTNGGSAIASRTNTAEFIRKSVHSRVGLDHRQDLWFATRPPQLYVYGRNDVYRRSIDNIGALVAAMQEVTSGLDLPTPILVSTFYMSPAAQIELFSFIDVFVTVQGAHEQTSLFMPPDGEVIEICPCSSTRTSYISRYGAFLPQQKYRQLEICSPAINSGDPDRKAQNVTLCPTELRRVQSIVKERLQGLKTSRGKKSNTLSKV